MILTSANVEAVFIDCLFRDGEVIDGAVPAVGVLHTFGFHPERLESHRADVESMLAELPTNFRVSGGGGWSFLNLCVRADGVQWTGLHKVQEELVALAIGLGLGSLMPGRELWPAMPGGLPYFQIAG